VLPLGLAEPVWVVPLEQPYSGDSMGLRALTLGLAEPVRVVPLEQPYSGDSMGLRALTLGLAEPVWAEVVQALRGWAARPSRWRPGRFEWVPGKWLRAIVLRSAVARKRPNDQPRSDSNKRNLSDRFSFE
jgi:hypothetical protein